MAKIEKEIKLLTADELDGITAETIKDDTATASHLAKLDRIIKALTAERKAMADALFEKWEHKKPDNSVFKVSIYDYYKLNETELREKESELYEKYKTKLVHVEKVTG